MAENNYESAERSAECDMLLCHALQKSPYFLGNCFYFFKLNNAIIIYSIGKIKGVCSNCCFCKYLLAEVRNIFIQNCRD